MKYKPTWCCSNIFNLDYLFLKKNNIKYILTDLDNTLAPYDIETPDKEVINLINKLKELDFEVIIVSNNTGNRVKLFASELDVNYIWGAKKPFTSVISKYLKEKKIDLNDCVIIGDQMVTDIKCANKLKCRCILTKPLSKRESIVTFINRRIDIRLRKKYNLDRECINIDRSEE